MIGGRFAASGAVRSKKNGEGFASFGLIRRSVELTVSVLPTSARA
jgi:hypothetical protein